MPLAEVQAALVSVFKRWGQPGCFRVDNGLPFADPGSDLVPVLTLWLIGLGIDVLRTRPRQPTDNAKVERMQGVTAAWAEPNGCANEQVLQQRLEVVAEVQRTRYPVRRLGGKVRTVAYPALLAGGSAYRPETFDLERVLAFLARGQWVRIVSEQGQVELYSHRWSVGKSYRRQRVHIHLDPHARCWIVCDERGQEINRRSAAFLSAENICSLCISERARERSLRRKQRKEL